MLIKYKAFLLVLVFFEILQQFFQNCNEVPFLKQGQNLINFNGKNYLMNGMNIGNLQLYNIITAWNNYGWDFGKTSYGNGYNPTWWDNAFKEISQFGVNSVRIWIHCDGQQTPLYDQNGYVTGLNDGMIQDLQDMLSKARKANLMVALTLWDFNLLKSKAFGFLQDNQKLQSYIDKALIPLIKGLESQQNILAWEIINEPEWLQDQGHSTWGQVQNFVGRIADAIHLNSKKYVTLGSASIKWNSNVTPAVGNKWSDSVLKSVSQKEKAYLDFYQIHYYDWIPFQHDFAFWKLDKPTVVGEVGKYIYYILIDIPRSQHYYNWQMQELSYDHNFAGIWFWAYKSGGSGTFDDYKKDLLDFRNKYPNIIDYRS